MNKNMYSLILSEDVVAEVDRLAYDANTSRSNMVNRILAEYVSMQTPETAARDIFAEIEDTLLSGRGFQRMLGGDLTMNLRTALTYKYNPTVRYSIDLSGVGDDLGELRVSFRTQNSELSMYMTYFFKLWQRIEKYCYGREIKSSFSNGRFTRVLRRPKDSEEKIGEAISCYITCFDHSLKTFFDELNRGVPGELASNKVEHIYRAMNTSRI